MERNELEQRIIEMPEKIRAQHILVMELTGTSELLKVIPEKIKSLHYEKILAEKDGGKLKYSNQDMRDIALEKVLDEDMTYEHALSLYEEKIRELKIAIIELDGLHNLFKAYLAVANFAGMGK